MLTFDRAGTKPGGSRMPDFGLVKRGISEG